MDSSALLDYALLQLTPTRTRCDLVVVSGGKSEKIASGLVEPFVSHLKFAEDQIPRGGYSITLRPPIAHASWFTKNTVQRFMRFISTPEILERSVQIEREILQIESSVQSNELSHTNITGHESEGCTLAADRIIRKSIDSSKIESDVEKDDVAVEEPSRCHLQRVLEARKVVLKKEQAMAYARALVAGFEVELVDLISFADAFGASRLREACVDFEELYKKKRTDGQWMEELAAMKASSLPDSSWMGTSREILWYGNNGSSQSNGLSFQSNEVPTGSPVSNGSFGSPSDMTESQQNPESTRDNDMAASVQKPFTPAGQIHLQGPWSSQIPRYVYHSQNVQIPPHIGYPFPPFYPGHAVWPQNMDNRTNANSQWFNNHQYYKSVREKEKSSNGSGPETFDDDGNESSDSDSSSELDANRKPEGKHSSRDKSRVKRKNKCSKKVVIRNINYITSKRNVDKHEISNDSSSVESVSANEVASLEMHQGSKAVNSKNGIRNGNNGYSDQDITYDLAGKVGRVEEKNENWNAFQNLLRNHEESTSKRDQQKSANNFEDELLVIHKSDNNISVRNGHSVDLGSQKDKMSNIITYDSVVLAHSSVRGEGALDPVNFVNGESVCTSIKKRDHEDTTLILKKSEEFGGNSLDAASDFASVSTKLRNRWKDEDWFIVNRAGNLEADGKQILFETTDTTSFGGDRSIRESSKGAAPIDDSFMVHSRLEVDDRYDYHSQWRTDISNVFDWTPGQNKNVEDSNLEKCRITEPDDLCVVLVRNDQSEPTGTSWNPEMVHGMDIYNTQIDKRSTIVEPKSKMEEDKLLVNGRSTNTRSNGGPSVRTSTKDGRSKVLKGSQAKIKKTNPTSKLETKKNKLEMEEEIRQRMEELVIQRQKRIAERTAAGGLTPAASNRVHHKPPLSSKLDKQSHHSMLLQTKILTSSKARS